MSTELRHLDGIKSLRKDRKRPPSLFLRSHPSLPHPSVPLPPPSPPASLPLIPPVRLFAAQSGGVRVSESRTVLRTGSAGHHRITALSGGGGDWTRSRSRSGRSTVATCIARSPETCRSFSYSPFSPFSPDYFRAPSPRRCRTRRKVSWNGTDGNAQSDQTWHSGLSSVVLSLNAV